LELPAFKFYDPNINHAPKRKEIRNRAEKKLAMEELPEIFPEKFHLFLQRNLLTSWQHMEIYMYRFRPDYEIKARHMMIFPYRFTCSGSNYADDLQQPGY